MDEANRPLNLDEAERHGATRFGSRIVRLDWVWDDGRQGGVDLPRSFAKPLTRRQLAILKVLAANDRGLPRKEVAGSVEKTRGTWGQQVNDLLARGLAFEIDGLLTDSLEKLKNKE